MTDNVPITPGVGSNIATDDIGGVHYQRVKATFGVDGVAVDVSDTNPFPVTGTFFQATQPVSGDFYQALQPVSVTGDVSVVGAVAVSNFPATQAISVASLPLPSGAASETTLAALLSATPTLAITIPTDTTPAPPVRQVSADLWRLAFSSVQAGVESGMTLLQTGGGMAVNQAGGNLVITSGTTANAETLIRSDRTFRGALSMRYKTILSQRIANNNFSVELADIVGSALAFTINSATSVTVTIPSNPFTSANVGQSMNLGQIVGAAGIPGRWAIASVSGNNVTFTVAAWPASGSGTLLLWGYNYYRARYTSTTATNVAFDTQRKGWNSGDSALTINTTASPGHVGQVQTNGQTTNYADSLVATNAGYQFTARGSRIENLPDDQLELYLFIRVLNGTSAPATTTTWTVGFVSVEMTGRQKVMVAASDQSGGSFAQPVQVMGGTLGTQPVSGTVTATGVAGAAAHSAAASGNPVQAGGVVATAVSTAEVAGDVSRFTMTTGGQQLVKPYGLPETDWQYTGALTTTTAAAAKAAGAAGVRNYVTDISYQNTSAVATTVLLLDNVTTIGQWHAPANMALPAVITFPTPKRGTAATAMNVNCGTAAANVLINVGGYQAP
jgi:hypothetical protein